jgi:hypothetical protein
MKRKTALLLFACAVCTAVSLFFILPAEGQTVRVPGEGTINEFFTRLQRSKTEAAVDFLWDRTEWAKVQRPSAGEVENDIENMKIESGGFLGREMLDIRSTADRYAVVSVMAVCEHRPLLFVFSLYRPENRWLMYSLEYSDNLPDMLNRSAMEELFEEDRK